jgi:hypothetical protein
MTTTHTAVWPVLTYLDAHAAIDFLTKGFGFEARACYTRDGDPSIVEHAEMRWPLGGGVMFGTAEKDDGPFGKRVLATTLSTWSATTPTSSSTGPSPPAPRSCGACATRTTGPGASRSATPRATSGASARTAGSDGSDDPRPRHGVFGDLFNWVGERSVADNRELVHAQHHA